MQDLFKSSGGTNLFRGLTSTQKSRKPKDDRALETGGSNLEKVMSFLDRPGAAERQAIINLHQGNPVGQGVGDILTGKNVDHPSGSDVIGEFRGQRVPDTKLGRAAQAVAGFAMDVLNPADPLNWIGVGEVSKAGKVAMKAGKLLPWAKGLQAGERTLLSARLPFTSASLPLVTRGVSEAGGQIAEGLGKAAMAVPGVKATADFLKPKFTKLAEYSNKATAGAASLFNKESKLAKADTWDALKKSAVKKINAGELDQINPEVSKMYKAQGLEPSEMADAEVKRILDKPIAERGLVNEETKGVKAFVSKVPTGGDTIPELSQLAKLQQGTLTRIGIRAKSMGLQGSLGEFFGAPRIMSKETENAIERVGGNAGGGSAGRASRVFDEMTQGQVEAAKQNPAMRAALFKSIFPKEALQKNGNILDMFNKLDPQAASFYERDSAKSFQKYLEAKTKQISVGDQVGEMMKNPSIARKAPLPTDVKVKIPPTFEKVMRGIKADGAKVNIGHMYMHPETAHEFNNFVGIMTDKDKMNSVWGYLQPMLMAIAPLTNLFKRLTLLSAPGTIPYNIRNIISNTMQSAMANAVSPDGVKIGLKMTPIIAKAGDDPRKFMELIKDLPTDFHGLNLPEEMATIKNSNLLNENFTRELYDKSKGISKAERFLGVGVGAKLSETFENMGRIQHYITRRLQGWNPQAAIADVRKYLYDYSGGLSPQLKQLRAVFPFLSWTRLNVPVMFEHMITRPGKFAIPQRAKQNIEKTLGTDAFGNKPDERALDEYIKGDWHIRWGFNPDTGKWSYIRLKNTIPMADLEDFTSVDRFVDLMTSSLTPFIKTPIENATNKSLFFKTAGGEGAPIENYQGETGKFLGLDITRKNINWFKNIRPLAMANQMIDKKPIEDVSMLSGFSPKPVDLNKATDYAKMAYDKRKSNLEISKKRQLKHGKPTTDIDNLLKQLRDKSYAP